MAVHLDIHDYTIKNLDYAIKWDNIRATANHWPESHNSGRNLGKSPKYDAVENDDDSLMLYCSWADQEAQLLVPKGCWRRIE